MVEGHELDVLAVRALLAKYRQSEDACDLVGQGSIMTSDRVLVSQFASGRRVDNDENMRIQQAQADRRLHVVPGLKQFSEDRDLLIRFSGHGQIAIASFYRHVTRVFPPGTAPEVMKEFAGRNELISVVLEKIDSAWLMIHTHVGAIGITG